MCCAQWWAWALNDPSRGAAGDAHYRRQSLKSKANNRRAHSGGMRTKGKRSPSRSGEGWRRPFDVTPSQRGGECSADNVKKN